VSWVVSEKFLLRHMNRKVNFKMVQSGKTKVGMDTLELPLVSCIIVLDELTKNPGRDLLRWVRPHVLPRKQT